MGKLCKLWSNGRKLWDSNCNCLLNFGSKFQNKLGKFCKL